MAGIAALPREPWYSVPNSNGSFVSQPGSELGGATPSETPKTIALIEALDLEDHREGGYLKRTDEDQIYTVNSRIPNGEMRRASSCALYLLTPRQPVSFFHTNKARIVHALHTGRARYIVIHPNESDGHTRIETFIVGHNIAKGERLQWIVEPNTWKATILLPDEEGKNESKGMLITEVCSVTSDITAYVNRLDMHSILGDRRS
jgi:uncharacterized protein